MREGVAPRVNFDTFLDGIIAVFILTTNENWNNYLYYHMLAF
jgi:hypothetical protein